LGGDVWPWLWSGSAGACCASPLLLERGEGQGEESISTNARCILGKALVKLQLHETSTSHGMLSIAIQTVFYVGIIALLYLCWRLSKWPKWRIRVVVYGWAVVFLWTILWAVVLPMSLRNVMDSQTLSDCFPDGTMAAGTLFAGWFWPLIIVLFSRYRDRKRKGDDHVA